MKRSLYAVPLLFIVPPLLLLWKMGSDRTWLPVALSALTVVGFALLVAQFYLQRGNRPLVLALTMKWVLRWHKVVGYCFAVLLLFHPLFVLVPRLTGAGATVTDSLLLMLTTWNSGIISGEVAWVALLVLLLSSLLRRRLPLSYRSWRLLHGGLALVILGCGLWHAATLGRHFDGLMTLLFCLLAAVGAGLYLVNFTPNLSAPVKTAGEMLHGGNNG